LLSSEQLTGTGKEAWCMASDRRWWRKRNRYTGALESAGGAARRKRVCRQRAKDCRLGQTWYFRPTCRWDEHTWRNRKGCSLSEAKGACRATRA